MASSLLPQSPTSTTDSSPKTTTIMNLDEDALVQCAGHLSLLDISNLAMSCKSLRRVAYSDPIWLRLFREHWPGAVVPTLSQSAGRMREAYLSRLNAVNQFRFSDPLIVNMHTTAKLFDHVMWDKNDIICSQGSSVQMINISRFLNGNESISAVLSDHNARITCIRLFPLHETTLFRSEMQRKENVLVTSSCDHSIRLWWKGSCQRCFRGHSGPVSTLSDKLLGNGSVKLLASGGEDGTVRLWSLSSTGKRGQHALKATLHGHQKPIILMSVAGHKASLLVTVSKDSKVRVWDANASSAVRSSCCVGMTSVPGAALGMKCHESLLYVAAGSSVVTIDLRTMQKVSTVAIYQPKLYSFAMLPSKFLICTGGKDKAMLWDVRMNQKSTKPEPIAELDGHVGPVVFLHMDPYKIVAGGPEDSHINVWESDTGALVNSLSCCDLEATSDASYTAMAISGSRIAVASLDEGHGLIHFRDFFKATCPIPVLEHEEERDSKFWDSPTYYSDTYSSDE